MFFQHKLIHSRKNTPGRIRTADGCENRFQEESKTASVTPGSVAPKKYSALPPASVLKPSKLEERLPVSLIPRNVMILDEIDFDL